ncbi:MAG: threonine synthase [Bacteroidetes bacterium]|nr:threonine synthase [Bacteroidota bacterium]MBU1371494.1 threonine synthase [Bacteroidota bacterium]MBU1485724.1 threonine synthase [Bacteroidota bacterium]MBU1759400.1 threonine synthase [Bacteroidota bacterium]MBU2268977.1 threonine synthase [Bacteroidota bacterium]
MKLYSTKNHHLSVDFETAVFNSLPADKGLYMPTVLPQIDEEVMANWDKKSLPEIAFETAYALLKDDISAEDLKAIIDDAANFDAPLHQLEKDVFVLELFHGPSLAFKDFGGRFMSRIMAHFLKKEQKEIQILVATSGDTGGAVALGFLNVPGIKVTILYPKGKVSPIQELQLTTNGNNIQAIAIDGTFDDCQALVKKAFHDEELNEKLNLTSANSINISRLIPQMFYYANTYAKLKDQFDNLIFVTPSGNFGNIAAGMMAWKMGLPVSRFIAATNSNDIVPEFLETGIYKARPSVQTLANAMDVGDPSNFVRILDMFDNNLEQLKEMLTSYSYNDEEIKSAIDYVYKEKSYVVCPHTATGFLAVTSDKIAQKQQEKTAYVVLATAHPCKFPDVFKEMGIMIEEPEQVKDLYVKEKICLEMRNSFDEFKGHLVS